MQNNFLIQLFILIGLFFVIKYFLIERISFEKYVDDFMKMLGFRREVILLCTKLNFYSNFYFLRLLKNSTQNLINQIFQFYVLLQQDLLIVSYR